jgi:hypothetical protein
MGDLRSGRGGAPVADPSASAELIRFISDPLCPLDAF